MLHGVVAWALATLVLMWLTASAVSCIVDGAFSMVGNVASARVLIAASAALRRVRVATRAAGTCTIVVAI